jgi:hypothetical protein
VTATDGTAQSSTTLTWTVTDPTPPTIATPRNQKNTEGDRVRLAIGATDADSFSATGLPAGLSIDSTTGVISGTVAASAAGKHVVTVTVNDDGQTASAQFTWTVADLPITHVLAQKFQATEGVSTGTVTVATFTDPAGSGNLADYVALIAWGDGTTDTGVLVDSGGGHFSVTGSHTYGEEGTYQVKVRIQHDQLAARTVRSSIKVADAPLTATAVASFNAAIRTRWTGQLASFTDGDASATANDFRVFINWGDGTPLDTTSGQVTSSGGFVVSGGHTYHSRHAKTYTVTITIRDHGSVARVVTTCSTS